MRLPYLFTHFFFLFFLIGCNEQLKIEPIEGQSKTIVCSLNNQVLEIEISKGSLNANLTYAGRKSLVNLLKFQDAYQILMKFDSQIGQLKFNQAGTELIQFLNQQEKRTSCKTILAMKNKTTLVISHYLSTFQQVDHIILLNNGRMI